MQNRLATLAPWFYCRTTGPIGSVGLLLLRVVVGAAFVVHGWQKLQNPMGWMGPEAPVPGLIQALAPLAEFGGGIGLILGLLTRVGALGILSVMVGALAMYHLPKGDPFVGAPGQSSFELAAAYLACAVLFLLLGPGRYSLDAPLFGGLEK